MTTAPPKRSAARTRQVLPAPPSRAPRWREPLVVALGAVLLLAIGAAALLASGAVRVGGGSLRLPPVNPNVPAPLFSLTSASGKVSLEQFRGKVVFLFFGFASCPDTCPLTLQQAAAARASLDEALQREIQVMMISVDPQRDSLPDLDRYMRKFDPSFLGLTGSETALHAIAEAYSARFELVPLRDGNGYFVNHSAQAYLVDKRGVLRTVYFPNQPMELLANDFRVLSREPR